MLRSVLSLIFVVVYSKTVSAAIRPPCYTKGGNPCQFPFTYHVTGKQFFECTKDGSNNDEYWCATDVDRNGIAIVTEECAPNNEDYCFDDGRVDPPLPGACLTDDTGPDRNAPCKFPFIYRGQTHDECAVWNYGGKNQGKLWCSTQTDPDGYHANGNGKYGFCGFNCYSSLAPGSSAPGSPALGSSAPAESGPL